MHVLQWQVTDERVQLLQVHGVVADARQMDVLFEKLGSRFPKRPPGPDPELLGLPDLLNPAGQDQFRRFEVARSSAFVNRLAENLLFDMPDSTAIPQPWASFASHNCFPL